MLSFRVIPRLDIKGANLIKGIQMEGLRVLGKPADFAERYAQEGADELLYIDTVASLYGRNHLENILAETAERVFIPITVGGGIRSVGDIRLLLNSGADKVGINTFGIQNPDFISRAASSFGSQAVCVHIDAKRVNGHWEAYTDCGREPSGKDAIEWAHEAEALGAGEILLTSVDRDGSQAGADLELGRLMQGLGIPVVFGGGIGHPRHAVEAAGMADGIAVGAALHYGKTTIRELKSALAVAGVEVR